MEQQARKWFQKCLIILLCVFFGYTILFLVVDPYFHFHKPLPFLSYRLYDERYTNDGISRHFAFNNLITGTSMAQNYKPSEFDSLFDTLSVKETFSGAGYQELSDNVERALTYNPELKSVFYSVDYNGLIRDFDWCKYEDYPTYLYDDSVWNDVSYIYNKSIFYHGVCTNLIMTLTGQNSTTMDDYSSWDKETGLEYILQTYDRNNVATDIPSTLEPEEQEIVRKNIQTNLVDLANRHPYVQFYMIYTPYSICYFDSLMQEGSMERQFAAEKMATEMLLGCENVKLFNFFDQYDVITNLDNYRDKEHYSARINSQILEWVAAEEGLVTKDNYLERLEQEKAFYFSYDYDKIYK